MSNASGEDPTIYGKVKALLVRKGVDLRGVAFGVTNGVVNITGILNNTGSSANLDTLDNIVQEAALAKWLERQIKRISGVRDVIFGLKHIKKDGTRFRKR